MATALISARTAVTEARISRAEAWTTFASQSDAAYNALEPDVRLTYDDKYTSDKVPAEYLAGGNDERTEEEDER